MILKLCSYPEGSLVHVDVFSRGMEKGEKEYRVGELTFTVTHWLKFESALLLGAIEMMDHLRVVCIGDEEVSEAIHQEKIRKEKE